MVIEKMSKETYQQMMGEVLDQISFYEDTNDLKEYSEKVFILDLFKLMVKAIAYSHKVSFLNSDDVFNTAAAMLSTLTTEDHTDFDEDIPEMVMIAMKDDEEFKQIVTRIEDLSTIYMESIDTEEELNEHFTQDSSY